VASAASFAGPSGFNGDSILNVSGNQLPVQACNNDIPVNAGAAAAQVPLSDISALLGLVNTGPISSSISRSCTQTPTQADPTGITTSSTDSTGAADDPADDTTSGFNNDSIIQAANNQVPLQLCNNDIPVNAGAGAVQVPVDGVSIPLGLINTGALTSTADRTCAQTPGQANGSTVSTSSSSS
jgi:hypothetical protein